MLILMAVVFGVAAGLLKRGSLVNLVELRLLWLAIPSFAAATLVSQLPGIALFPKAALLCLSYFSLIAFAAANRRYVWGSLLFALGALSNFTVIAANSFRMPISPAALEIYPNMSAEAVIEQSAGYFVALENNANLLLLGDVIYVPLPLIGGFVSAGDIILMLGMFLLIFSCMTAGKREPEPGA